MLPKRTIISVPGEELSIHQIVEEFDFNDVTGVLSYNGRKTVESSITSTRKSDTRDLLLIETNHTEISLILTPSHKVYDVENKKYTRASEIKQDTVLKHIDGIETHVTKVRKITNNMLEDVYTLSIDKTQCFYANGILVHNDL